MSFRKERRLTENGKEHLPKNRNTALPNRLLFVCLKYLHICLWNIDAENCVPLGNVGFPQLYMRVVNIKYSFSSKPCFDYLLISSITNSQKGAWEHNHRVAKIENSWILRCPVKIHQTVEWGTPCWNAHLQAVAPGRAATVSKTFSSIFKTRRRQCLPCNDSNCTNSPSCAP